MHKETMDSLEKWQELHKIHNRWHAITLSQYIKNKMILRGLHIQEAPSAVDSESFVRAWKSILNRCSFALIDITIHCVIKDECMQHEDWKESKKENI